MNNQKQERMLESCDQLHDEDGTDPRHRRGPRRSRDANHRKTQQLCKQVAETIGLVLAGDFDDELLHNLQVVRVTPAPNCSQLLVALRADLEPGTATRNEVTLRLERVAGHLRSEVAMAISRRRVPRLIYQIVAEQDD